MPINKTKIFESLRKMYNLEEDYEEIHSGDFDGYDAALKELLRIYHEYPLIDSCCGKPIESDLATNLHYRHLEALGKHTDPEENTLEFIKGMPLGSEPEYYGHQWHLASFYNKTAELLTPVLSEIVVTLHNFKDFEDLFNAVESTKNDFENHERISGVLSPGYLKAHNRKIRTLGFGQTCIYDFSLRAAYRHGRATGSESLMPRKFVYTHSKPGLSFRIMRELGLFANLPTDLRQSKEKYRGKVETALIADDFKPYKMDAIDIENFLCVMHKVFVWFDEKYNPKK